MARASSRVPVTHRPTSPSTQAMPSSPNVWRSWAYFKHQGAVMGPLFRTFGPMMAFDKMDPAVMARTWDLTLALIREIDRA